MYENVLTASEFSQPGEQTAASTAHSRSQSSLCRAAASDLTSVITACRSSVLIATMETSQQLLH